MAYGGRGLSRSTTCCIVLRMPAFRWPCGHSADSRQGTLELPMYLQPLGQSLNVLRRYTHMTPTGAACGVTYPQRLKARRYVRVSAALHLFGEQSGWSTSSTSMTSVAGAILVNAPTHDGWYFLRGQAGAMSRATAIYALLFSGLSRREGARGEVGVARIECSRTR